MQATLIENNGTGRMAYDSLILDNPKAFSALNSKLAFKIVKALADSPASAIDVSRKLKIHEQKVYYHVKRLERAGIIYTISSEKRHGMIAKIFSVVSPVISAKLYDKGVEVKENTVISPSKELLNFLNPFIENSTLNSIIVVGDPSPHGKYEEYSRDGVHILDFSIFLGMQLNNQQASSYKLDVEINPADKKNNLILVGNPRTNIIIDEIREFLPIKYDFEKSQIVTYNNTNYKDPRIGAILRITNPFDKDKKILLFTGLRSRGVKAATLAFTKYTDETLKTFKNNETFIRVVEGLDKDGDRVVDDIKFIE